MTNLLLASFQETSDAENLLTVVREGSWDAAGTVDSIDDFRLDIELKDRICSSPLESIPASAVRESNLLIKLSMRVLCCLYVSSLSQALHLATLS